MNSRRTWLLDFAVIALLASALIWPIFKTKYYENWLSIDATFIADGRFLSENLPHPGWNPLWYGGTRWDYIYPPALRYGTALLSKAFGLIPARAYHLYTAIFYALGIGFVYLFARIGSGARAVGWLSAFGAATLCPSYLFLKEMRLDTQPYMPQRLNVLIRYGEGPHMTAFAILPLGLALAWIGLRAGKTRWLAASAAVIALVVSNNFYGATAVAMFFPILTWAVFCETQDWRTWLRAAAVAALSFALCSFWLTPSFLAITARNLTLVSQPGHGWSMGLAAALAVAFGALSWGMARKGVPGWTLFVTGAALFFSLNVLGNYFFDFRVTGEPSRLVPEEDLCIILLLVWGGYLAWQRWPAREVRGALVVLALICCAPAYPYFEKPWRHFTRTSEYKHLLEYQLPDWVEKNRPNTRSYVTGTVRFWWNVWHNNAQIGGGSEQGVHNFGIIPFFWRTVTSPEPKMDIAWMQAFGVDQVIVNDKTSKLPITDYEHPHKYQGALPVLWEDGKGNWIYEIPRKHGGLARVVEAARYDRIQPPDGGDDAEHVNAYADLLEKSETPAAATRWLNTSALEITAETAPGQTLVVQVAHDEYWRAYENGAAYPVRKDAFGQMRVDVPPGKHRIEMRFETPRENTVGRGASLAAFAVLLWLLLKRRD